VNQLLQKTALQRLLTYQREGNQALGVYNDKRDAVVVPEQFAYMLSYTKALPKRLPDFYQYLLAYPNAKPANVDDTFYWARVKFGLGPTLRVVQVVMMRRCLCHRRETALFKPLIRDRVGPLLLCPRE